MAYSHISNRKSVDMWEKTRQDLPEINYIAPAYHNTCEEIDDRCDQFDTSDFFTTQSGDTELSLVGTKTVGFESENIIQVGDKINVLAKDLDQLCEMKMKIDERFKLSPADKNQSISPWYFGLHRNRFGEAKQQIQLKELDAIIENHLLWYKVKRINNNESVILHSFHSKTEWNFRYGALSDLNLFVYPETHSWPLQKNVSVHVELINKVKRQEYIRWTFDCGSKRMRHILNLSDVENCAVVSKRDSAWSIYIFQKCNTKITESPVDNTKTNSNKYRSAPPSQHIRIWESMGSYFSHIEFTVRLNSSNSAEENICRIFFQSMINLLRSSKISVYYGKIQSKLGPRPCFFITDPRPLFPCFVKNYAWEMLSVVGYRLQVRISNRIISRLTVLSEQLDQSSYAFYRLCLYLIQIFRMKPFIDLGKEIDHAVELIQRYQENLTHEIGTSLQSPDPNWVYVGSVTLTPTTIRIKPLRLCETNRVLRAEENGRKLFGDSLESFVLVDIRDENNSISFGTTFSDIQEKFRNCMMCGFSLGGENRIYKYLHHSQSQLRSKQFWFYHHEENLDNGNYSFQQAYAWMGTFKDNNLAKYSARMGQCFTTTKKAISIPKTLTRTIEDIKTTDQKLLFTDGCGRMSLFLRNEIKDALRIRDDFSVVQIRYAGAKGIISLDNRLPKEVKICLRPSMIKFESPCEDLEVCKVSTPMSVYLNRQSIFLIRNRKVPEINFMILQQYDNLRLIENLTKASCAKSMLRSILPKWFRFEKIESAFANFTVEPFFRQLIICGCLQSMRTLLRKTRIRVPIEKGRYMFGIADEYGVLEEGEVFVQYTVLDDSYDYPPRQKRNTLILDGCQVVITKNPCHHPGDVRTFMARNRPELRHLKDVVVFSTKGQRPAPHDISGSDLDGDEYTVIWDEDLVPYHTENFQPYDFDSEVILQKHSGVIKHDDITDTVLNIMDNDCLGQLSNIHLAFADKFGIGSTEKKRPANISTVELAGYISQEVDSGKTGYHPISRGKIQLLNEVLEHKRPEYMGKNAYQTYKSEHLLGKLYRSARRTVPIWNELVKYHRHLRHWTIKVDDEEDQETLAPSNSDISADNIRLFFEPVDSIIPSEIKSYAEKLWHIYRQELLEILSLYGISHESDLWSNRNSRETLDNSEGSAHREFENLIDRTRRRVHLFEQQYCDAQCDEDTDYENLCQECQRIQRIMAITCYQLSYTSSDQESQSAQILSLPWLFSTALIKNKIQRSVDQKRRIICDAMRKTLNSLCTRDRVFLSSTQLTLISAGRHPVIREAELILCIFIEVIVSIFPKRWTRDEQLVIGAFAYKILTNCTISEIQFDSELQGQNRHSSRVQYLTSLINFEWRSVDDEQLIVYFRDIVEICCLKAKRDEKPHILQISEEILLKLLRMAVRGSTDE